VESVHLTTRLSGESPGAPWATVDWDADPDWEFTSATDDTPEQLYTLWDDSVARARLEAVDGRVGEDPPPGWQPQSPSDAGTRPG
jgi:hypothetical protein